MKKLLSNGSLAGVLLGLVLVLSGCTEAHDVDAILGPPAFAGQGGGDGDGDGDIGDGDGDGDTGDGDGDIGDGDGDTGDGDGDTGSGCNNCAPSDVGGQFGVTPCCTRENKCGLDVGAIFGGGDTCLEQDAPGTPNSSCPSFTFMGANTPDGCSQADGTCGVNDTFLGLGCTENPDGNGESCSRTRGGRGPQ
jgi:hypothetical protein